MTCHLSDTKIDAREIYDEEGIGHSPVCECEGCILPLPHDGYADAEQAAYYNGPMPEEA